MDHFYKHTVKYYKTIQRHEMLDSNQRNIFTFFFCQFSRQLIIWRCLWYDDRSAPCVFAVRFTAKAKSDLKFNHLFRCVFEKMELRTPCYFTLSPFYFTSDFYYYRSIKNYHCCLFKRQPVYYFTFFYYQTFKT